MYGHSVGPPPSRGEATVITLRVLFAAAGFLSCGLLACVPLFRIAVLRGRGYDWAAAWLSLPVSIVLLAVVGSLPESDHRTDAAMGGLLLLGAAATAYFLAVDIRAHAAPRPPFPGYLPPQATTVAPPYGAPAHPTHPMGQAPMTGTPYAPPPPPVPPQHHAAPQHPVTPPPHHQPAPARIDQVRAELDELSDYLRRHEGDGAGGTGHQGGR